MKNNRFFALALALALCLGLTPHPALAYDTGAAGQANIISVGAFHTGFVDANGALWMWGENDHGQLGNGTTTKSYVPIKVLDNVAAVSCAQNITAAIKTDGTLWMWGENDHGQLGNGTTANCLTPVKVLDDVAVVDLTSAGYIAAIKTDGTLWIWGPNISFLTDIRDKARRYVPNKVLDNVAAVSCGDVGIAAIKTDGTLWMWGENSYGELGNGTTTESYVPIKVLDNVAAVSYGGLHTAAIKTDGTLWMWGLNNRGQLGNGGGANYTNPGTNYPVQTVPVKVMDNVAAVSCEESHCTAAVKTDGTLWMWGENDHGQLGNGTTTESYVPIKVLDNVAAVSCGFSNTAAIKTDGTLWTWGPNLSLLLGIEDKARRYVPNKVLDNVAAVSFFGGSHTAAVKTDGTLWMWGRNDHGQLGNGGGGNAIHGFGDPIQTVPIQITGLTAYLGPRIPSYRYPAIDNASDAMTQAVVSAAQKENDTSEPAAIYQLSDGLYYVLLEQGGAVTGHVVKGVKEKGETVWKVIQSHDEPAAQEELDQLVTQELSTSNLSLDFGRLSSLSSVQAITKYIQDCLDNLNGLTVNDPAKGELATFIENALASLASASVSGPDNRLTVSSGTVSDIAGQSQSAEDSISELLESNGITLNKELETLLRVLWQDVDGTKPCQLTIDRDLAAAMNGNSLRVMLGDDRHYIQLSADTVSGLLAQYETMSIQVSQSGENTYTVNFLDKDGNVLERIELPVMIGLPASGPLNTVMASYAGGSDNWGGQYDENTKSMAFETRYSGQYEVLENDVAISDIGELDQEIQTAIMFLVSKGYMSATDGVFQPGAPLSRYDFTQALVGMFFALDRSLTTSFPDVSQGSAYYAYVASAEADSIVLGFEDGTFGGERNITVEQMLALAARTLRERKGYLPPENAEIYLSSFADADQISGWARELVAQTVRDDIMERSSGLNPQGEVSRGQAALILYRLFLKLYEVSPVALELPPAAAVNELVSSPEPGKDGKTDKGSFPVAAAVIAGVLVFGAGAAGGAFVVRKRKTGNTENNSHNGS